MSLAGLAASLVGASGLTWARAKRNERVTGQTHPPLGGFVTVDDQRLHYVTTGAGTDLVLLHGSGGNLRDFTYALIDLLAPRYRVIAFDRPGQGHSDPLPHNRQSLGDQAALCQRAAAKLGAPRPLVLGHSYGGAVALAWAVTRPDALSGLIPVAAPAYPWTTPLEPLHRFTAHPLLGPAVAQGISAWAGRARIDASLASVFDPAPVPAGYAAHFGPGLTLRRRALIANGTQRARLLADITGLAPRWPEIRVPTQILHGTADRIVGLEIHARPLAHAVPQARLTPVDGAGHMPHHSHPEAVLAAIGRAAKAAE